MKAGDRRVEIGRFFQYDHLKAGQAWIAWIDADSGSENEAQAFAEALMQDRLRLGRSKRREFGGGIEVASATEPHPLDGAYAGDAQAGRIDTGNGLVLWCLSDVALVDGYGTPVLAPEPKHFGIDGFAGELDPVRSQITTRRYAPHNLNLGSRDREHAVIAAGSVLVYRLDTLLNLDAFRVGVGLWRERGLGLVWPNAPMLMQRRPAEAVANLARADQAVERELGRRTMRPNGEPVAGEGALIAMVKSRATSLQNTKQIANLAARLTTDIETLIRNARNNGKDTPSSTQWSRLAGQASAAANFPALVDALFGAKGMCMGGANDDWKEMRAAFKGLVEGERSEAETMIFLKAMSRAARQVARKWKRR